ncbi:MAG TPA: Z1 domain-containing protein, partial [Myxococcota bacterium]|nr:Z1 domain-containing protein [Myxococcota bacterium]
EDLMRLYLTEELVRWFTEMAFMEADLRDEIDRLNESGESPVRMGIRVRSHSAMLVTSRLKMKYGTTIQVGYSGQHPQTIVFPLNNLNELKRNVEAANRLLSAGRQGPVQGGGFLLEQGSPAAILTFLRSYAFAAESRSMDPSHLCRWIEARVADGDLAEWRVYVDSRQDRSLGGIRLGSLDIGLVSRSRLPGTMSIGALLDPRHEGLDLLGGPDAYRKGRSYDAMAMRRARPRDQGLLLLYPISPASTPDSKNENRVALFEPGWARPEAVIGFGLSLPFTEEDGATEYVVGRKWAEDAR